MLSYDVKKRTRAAAQRTLGTQAGKFVSKHLSWTSGKIEDAMSTLVKLRHFQDLRRSSQDDHICQLSIAFQAAAKPLVQPGLLSLGLVRGIEFDLLYSLLRHTLWCKTSLFAAVLVDFLATEYVLPKAVAKSLIDGVLPLAKRLIHKECPFISASDQEFLLYICAESWIATDELELAADLGIGKALLKRIKETLTMVGSESPSTYWPELESNIAEALRSLAAEMQKTPWAAQVHLLKFYLFGIEAPWCDLIVHAQSQWLFDLLVRLGQIGSWTIRQANEALTKTIPRDFQDLVTQASTRHLLQQLLNLRFVIAIGVDRWSLDARGQQLTATAFAHQSSYPAEKASVALPTLCSAYQAAVIQMREDWTPLQLVRLLEQRPLSPKALQTALSKLEETADVGLLQTAVAKLLQGESSPWLREATCEWLEKSGQQLDIAPLVRTVAQSDASAAVRAAAWRVAHLSES